MPSKKPLGQVTRGKTAINRLRQVDNFVLRYAPDLLTRQDGFFAAALFVDLGYGAKVFTTLESADRFRRLNPALPVLGVEIEPERVAAGQPYADRSTFFRLGGFNLPLQPGEHVRLIRAFNVLRQYEQEQVRPAWEQMAQTVLPGGLIIEGTSSPSGSIWVSNILRKTGSGLHQEALVFYTNFRLGFNPVEFQAVLPKNYIHRVTPGEPVFEFFNTWKAAVAVTSAFQTYGLRQWFMAAARVLRARGYAINTQHSWLSRGWMIWRHPPE